MATKEVVCESCEASFTIEYEMLGSQYLVRFCPFCNEELTEEEKQFIIECIQTYQSTTYYRENRKELIREDEIIESIIDKIQ